MKKKKLTREELVQMIRTGEDVSFVDTSGITDMSWLFSNASSFNQDISKWNTSKVKYMHAMFYGASSFNQDISKWNTSKVKDMHAMFCKASSFNQDISSWDTSKVRNMFWMFYNASSFNQENIIKWIYKNKIKINDFVGSKIYIEKLKYLEKLENIMEKF
jgi:surface protein